MTADRSAAVASNPDGPYAWFVALCTLLMASISFGAVTSIPILLTPLMAESGWSRTSVILGHTLAMFAAGSAGLMLGRWLDKSGFFRLALLGAIATGSGLILTSQATHVWQLQVAYGLLVGGLGQGTFFGALAAAVSLWFEKHRSLAISFAVSGQSVGGLIAPPALRYGAQAFGWRHSLFAYGVGATVVLALCALTYRRPPPLGGLPANASPAPALSRAADSLLLARQFRVMAVAIFLYNVSTFMILGHLTAFCEEAGLTPASSAAMLSVLLGTTLVSRVLGEPLAHRWGNFLLLLAVSILHTAGLALLAHARSPASILVAAVFIGLGFGGYLPGYAVIVRTMFPARDAGRRIAEIFFFAFLAAGAGSWVCSVLRELFGSYLVAFDAAFGASLAGLAILIAYRRLLHKL